MRDKVAIVTGGTRGIGRAIARALCEHGVNVMICSRHEERNRQTVAELNSLGGGRAAAVRCDVRVDQDVRDLVAATVSQFGGLDILVNNAGIGIFDSVEKLTPDQWRQVIDTNLSGVFYCCHYAIPEMKKRGGGHIINIGSLAGKNAFAGGAAYNASKFGLIGFSEALMLDVRYDDIRVSYILPGSVNTEFGGDIPGPSRSWELAPEDVAKVVIDVLTHDARAMASRVEIRPTKPPRR